jgi:hypothetical protein
LRYCTKKAHAPSGGICWLAHKSLEVFSLGSFPSAVLGENLNFGDHYTWQKEKRVCRI